MSLGFEQAGFDIALAVDSDAHHVTTHHRNFPYGLSKRASVAELTGEQLRRWLDDRPVDLLFGGPPCQGFSTMGGRDSDDPRNSLVHHFVRLVGDLRPRAVVMENVPGMGSGATAPLFRHAIASLEAHGYRVTQPVQALDASRFGVPQKRKRLFVLAIRDDQSPASIPYPQGPAAGQPPRPTVAQALEDLPAVDHLKVLLKADTTPYDKQPDNAYARFARGLTADPHDKSWRRAWDTGTASGCMRTQHAPKTVALYAACAPGTTVPGHKLPKLDPDGLAPTLRAGTTSAHGSFTAPRPVHPFLPRVITAREAARLHGYPDWFAFFPTKWHAYRQIGNSVCPPVARAVGDQVLDALGVAKDALPRPSLQLGMDFPLADDRPKTHRRLSHKAELAKVFTALWDHAVAPETGLPRVQAITASDIQRAIDSSGAQLPRIRADRVLVEAKRFRGVRQLLAAASSAGFTVMPSPDTQGGGRWVPLGTLGALGESDTIKVSSAEINDAATLPVLEGPVDDRCLLAALGVPGVAPAISGGALDSISVPRDLFGQVEASTPLASVCLEGSDAPEQALVILSQHGRMPKRSRLGTQLQRSGVGTILLAAKLTERHLLLATYAQRGGVTRELGRSVFAIAP